MLLYNFELYKREVKDKDVTFYDTVAV